MDTGFNETTNHMEKDPLSTITPVKRAFMDLNTPFQQQKKDNI